MGIVLPAFEPLNQNGSGVGDQAFTDASGSDVVAEAQVANILVVVDLTRRGGQTGPGDAEEILRHLVAQIRVE